MDKLKRIVPDLLFVGLLVVTFMVLRSLGADPDNAFAVQAFSIKLAQGLTCILLLFYCLRVLDRLSGTDFRHTILIIDSTPWTATAYRIARAGVIAAILIGSMGCTPATAAVFPDRYDRDIRRAVATYWPGYPDWLAWKAQLYQESRLDPRVVSPVGAAGLAQFMPATWVEVRRQLRLPPALSPHHDIAIQAGAYYMAQLRAQWSARRPALDRHQLAQASYNAGLGHLLAAQRRCGGAALYAEIIACLPAITGRHSAETITYVDRIARWRAMMAAGL